MSVLVTTTTWTVPRESREWIGPISLTNKITGLPIGTFDTACLPIGQHPVEADWAAPTVLGAANGVLVGPGTPLALPGGTYALWCRFLANPERPVITDFGYVIVT